MKRNILLIIAFILPLITISATQLFERTASSTAVTPDGYAKTVFVLDDTSKNAKMFVKDESGNEFYMEFIANHAPYFYFIPSGTYTVVKFENIMYCNTAHGTLYVGTTFDYNVGYITAKYKETPIEYNSFDRVVATDTTTPTPEGCQKVVFAINIGSTSVAEMIVKADDGKYYKITSKPKQGTGSDANAPYFYFIPQGSYKVIRMTNFSSCNTAAGTLTVGDTFYVGVEGHTSVGYFS